MARLLARSIGAFAAAGVVLSLCSATQVLASQPSQRPAYWHPWFEIGGAHNSRDEDSTGTTGTNRGETTIFAPIRGRERTLLFGQLTTKFFDDHAKEGNLAFGYRRMMPWGFNLGAWIGGDVRNTEIDNTFWQLSGGFEALSKNVDVRLNWYGPVTGARPGSADFAELTLDGHQIYLTGGEEVGLMGIDGEIGFRVPSEYLRIDPNKFELRAYAGAYHFDSHLAEDNVTGVKGRLELSVNDVIAALPGSRLTVDYEVSHDDVRDTRHDVGLRMRFPLSGGQPARSLASLSHQQRRMLDGIERDTDIITGRSKRENVEDALTGTDFDRVAYASAATDVTTTSAAAGDNSLIIANGEIQGSQTVQRNQTLQGGGSTIAVRGRNSGLVVPFTAPGAPALLTEPTGNNSNLLLEGSNTHIAGLRIVGYGEGSGHGVEIGSDKSNVFLTNLDISWIGSSGIYAADRNQFSVMDVSIARVGEDGISVDADNTAVVTGGSISDAYYNGIDIGERNRATIRDVVIRNPGISGINIGFDNLQIDVEHVSISDAGSVGIFIISDNVGPISITHSQMIGAGVSGIFIGKRNEDVRIANVSIADVDESGIDIDEDNTVDITATSITNTGEHGIELNDGNSVVIAGSRLSDIGQSAIYNNGDTTLRIAGNTFVGSIGGDIFNFSYGTAVVETGSIGNINTTISLGGRICRAESGGAFTGTIELDGTILIDDDGQPNNCN